MVSTNSGSCGLPLVSDVIVLVVENELMVAVAASVLSTCSVVPAGLEKFSPAPPTVAGDNTRPRFLYDQLTTATKMFSAQTGIGSNASPMSGTLSTFIGQVLTVQGQSATNASSLKEGQDVVVKGLQTRMNSESGVNIDQEMTSLLNLQTAYGANARVFSVVQQMLQSLLQM